MKWKRKYSCIAAGIVVCAVAVSAVGYYAYTTDTQETEESVAVEITETEDGTFTEEGTTQILTDSQLPAFTVNAVVMTVAEVYVESGTSVEEGDALLKISDESMEEAIAYYEDAVADAQEDLENAELDFQSGVLEAELELQSAQLTAESAESNYEASLSSLTVNVEEKKENYDETVEKIQELQTAVDDGSYYTAAGINEKQDAVTAAESAVGQTQEALTAAQNTYAAAQAALSADLASLKSGINSGDDYEALLSLTEKVEQDYQAVQDASTGLSQCQTSADSAQSTYEKAVMTFESAVKEYDTNIESANQEITELTESLEALYEEYEAAQREAETAQAKIQLEYETAVLEGKYADTEYEATLTTLQAQVDSLQDTLDSLLEEQAELLALEDGVICADRSGTIASVTYEAEDVLYGQTALVSYYNTDTIYISVEVSQELIAQLAVGDEVSVSVTGNRGGAVTGTISSIASSKTSGGSMSNVTYAVTISIDNADGALSSGSSATVTFEYKEQEEQSE